MLIYKKDLTECEEKVNRKVKHFWWRCTGLWVHTASVYHITPQYLSIKEQYLYSFICNRRCMISASDSPACHNPEDNSTTTLVLLFCSWPHRRVSGCCATVLQLVVQNSIRFLCYCSAVGRTEEYSVVVLLFCSWAHRRVSGCCATVLQLAAQNGIRLLCYCSAVGRTE